jgi:hypothetical protein
MISENKQIRDDIINTWEPSGRQGNERDSKRGSRSINGQSSSFMQRGEEYS